AAIVSISLNPLLYRALPFMERALLALGIKSRTAAPAGGSSDAAAGNFEWTSHRAIIIGHGPVGQTLCRLLRENSVEPVVVDLNIETIREIREQGWRAVYGDATHI